VTGVHVVTVPEFGSGFVVIHGHVMNQLGNARVLQRRAVHDAHQIDAGHELDRGYGHVVHMEAPEHAP
jgi:hypothetical protein